MTDRHVALPDDVAGSRLDVAAAAVLGISRSAVQRALKKGELLVDGVVAEPRTIVQGGEMLALAEPGSAASVDPVPDIAIVYEDNDMLVVDKPAGLVVHRTETGRVQPSVAAFARAHGVEDPDDPDRPGIVHRLDKDTSGLLVIAKHAKAKELLQRQFRERNVQKTYTALVRGRLRPSEAEIKLPIGRDRSQPLRRAVVPGGREAVTRYRTIEELPGATLVEIELHTGRTHQIRVHFAHIGHPVIGDTLYGDAAAGLSRQFLHASHLKLTSPSGKSIELSSPLPAELQSYLKKAINPV